eukprot:Plantae.Rhodophyta-Purpureofilum_apyrenoidigerum.ctg38990.p1 GENE.Plantae.Rhodophyta-Purpureofilum_apyrenoidigerum.ctg38990~~Plantae.Rhodophyta-Purpureofilum_apyrenoidigerum.ctg38990.p1  ORF type:complete len:193 (+),score=29.69 Plantae.Rhodophyta-Purpureofilum_apyrenoidigerum.ctg38990:72-650(+)
MGRRKLDVTHICNHCGKVFPRRYNLNIHRRIHTGDKPYSCDIVGCGRTFAWKSSLDSHHMSHEREQMSLDLAEKASCDGTFADGRKEQRLTAPEALESSEVLAVSTHELLATSSIDSHSTAAENLSLVQLTSNPFLFAAGMTSSNIDEINLPLDKETAIEEHVATSPNRWDCCLDNLLRDTARSACVDFEIF